MIQSSPKWPISAQMDRDKVDKKSVLRTWPSNCHKELFFALHLSFIMKKLQVKRKSRSSPLSSSHRAATVTALDAGVGRIHQSLQRFRFFHPPESAKVQIFQSTFFTQKSLQRFRYFQKLFSRHIHCSDPCLLHVVLGNHFFIFKSNKEKPKRN